MKFDKPLVLYGAGKNAADELQRIKSMGGTPVCFVDSDGKKQGTTHLGLPVFDFGRTAEKYPDFSVWVTPVAPVKFEIMETLTARYGVVPDRILNFEPYTKRRYCALAEQVIVIDQVNVRLCCEIRATIPNCPPYRDLSNDEIYAEYVKMRNETIESIACGDDGVCRGCDKIKNEYCSLGDDNTKIRNIAFGAGMVCQFKCVYCDYIHYRLEDVIEETDKTIGFVRWLWDNGLVDTETSVTIANGEITINPKYKEILELFLQNPCAILTNGMIYRQEIADMLRSERNKLNISLDSGTPETFGKVKGVDRFDAVCENIRKYAKHAHAGSVSLKYILIPGLNDNDEDIDGFLKISKEINAIVTLSRDVYKQEHFDANIDGVLRFAVKLIGGARKAGLRTDVQAFFYDGKHGDKIKTALDRVLA
jgi:pyruvate-formate lyase-activating enzyme